MGFQRYAIYVVPEGTALARFGASWLGRDVTEGRPVPHPETDLPLASITQRPRKYGFHGTVHWPVALKDPSPAGMIRLTDTVAEFCAKRAHVDLQGLELARLGRFLALVPTGDDTALKDMAADLVRLMHPLCAAPAETEIARRRAARLSPAQEAMLAAWGYPYVMDQFRFHMTLSGKMPKAQLPEVETVLNRMLPPVLPRPFVIDALSLMGEDDTGQFHLIERLPFGGAP